MSSPVQHVGAAEQMLWGARDELKAAVNESADRDHLARLEALVQLAETAFRAVRAFREKLIAEGYTPELEPEPTTSPELSLEDTSPRDATELEAVVLKMTGGRRS